MPEMPEVETIRRSLAVRIQGLTIKETTIKLARLIKWPTLHEFSASIYGSTIIRLERRAKYLLFYLDNEKVLVVHLRMTGRLNYVSEGKPKDPYSRIIFHFTNGDSLEYADTRTLGTLYLMPATELNRIYGLISLGPEPLSDEFTFDYLLSLVLKRKGKIKSLLLNQKAIGGIGNIYADESLSLAGIHPERVACTLTVIEVEKLHSAINEVIKKGIEEGGTTFRDYRDADGNKGRFQQELTVYGRKGDPCKTCGTDVMRTEVAGRGTHFCPNCQK